MLIRSCDSKYTVLIKTMSLNVIGLYNTIDVWCVHLKPNQKHPNTNRKKKRIKKPQGQFLSTSIYHSPVKIHSYSIKYNKIWIGLHCICINSAHNAYKLKWVTTILNHLGPNGLSTPITSWFTFYKNMGIEIRIRYALEAEAT